VINFQVTNAGEPMPHPPVSRDEVLRRAQYWVQHQVHYLSHDGQTPATARDPDGSPYRADCSGYVCMAWKAESQPSTSDFDAVGAEIDRADLLPGDALLWKGEGGYGPQGGHVLLFAGWLGHLQAEYLGYELAGGSCARAWTVPYPYLSADTRYRPWRYHGITG
jgi:cell wall-associated NlpC family hydrolase